MVCELHLNKAIAIKRTPQWLSEKSKDNIETSLSECPCSPEGGIQGQAWGRFMRAVAACAYASHGQGRLIPRSLWHMKVAPDSHVSGARVEVLTQALELECTSFRPSRPHAWDAMWTPGSQQAHNQQVVVAASQRVQPVGRQPPPNGYSCSHEASGISVDNPEVCGK